MYTVRKGGRSSPHSAPWPSRLPRRGSTEREGGSAANEVIGSRKASQASPSCVSRAIGGGRCNTGWRDGRNERPAGRPMTIETRLSAFEARPEASRCRTGPEYGSDE
jgi:hypothetical protein